jgi:hypothetical protein
MARMPRKSPPSPKTSRKIKHEAGIGLADPARLSNKQVQSLAGSVEAHIEPRRNEGRCPSRSPEYLNQDDASGRIESRYREEAR